jgi:hypothetical protein
MVFIKNYTILLYRTYEGVGKWVRITTRQGEVEEGNGKRNGEYQ